MLPRVKVLLYGPLFCRKSNREGRKRALLFTSAFLFFLSVLPATSSSQMLDPDPFGISFTTAGTFGVGDEPSSVFCADLDNDGDLDLAVANAQFYTGNVSILINQGNWIFLPAVNYSAGAGPNSVFCARLNNDNFLDLAVTNGGSNDVSILINNGDGTFFLDSTYGVGSVPSSVYCTDLDGDNDQDLAVANGNFQSYTISILKNNGDGTFQAKVDYTAGHGPYSIFCADLDGQNGPDLAVANLWGNSISIFLNDGSGNFGPATTYAPGGGGHYPISIYCADLDGDGDLDVVSANALSNNLWVLMNDGYGNFGPIIYYGAGDAPYSVFCVDLEGDDDIDMVVADRNGDNVFILENDGSGNFLGAGTFPVGDGPSSVFCADLDLDADPDLAVANYYSSNVSILENESFVCQFAPAVNYPTTHSPGSVFCADLDGDGDLDLAAACGSDSVSILENTGGGIYQLPVSYYTQDEPRSVFCADLDGDADLDLVVANAGSNSVSILKNDGSGIFASAVNYGTGDSPFVVFCADLDDDSDLDIAVDNLDADASVSILKNNGDGTFSNSVNYDLGQEARSVFCADLDGDGDLDMAVLLPGEQDNPDVSILINDGTGAFTVTDLYYLETYCYCFFCADLDGDNDLDLVTGGYDYNVHILKNNGNGTFQSPVAYASGCWPYAIFCADLNGDNYQDLALTKWQTADSVHVLINDRTGAFLSAVAFEATGELDAGFSIFSADLDGDGDLDLAHANTWHDNVSILKNLTQLPANQPPWAFSLLTPENGATTPGSATFRWRIPYDPNFGDQFRYDLYISTTPGFEIPTIIPNLAVSKYETALPDGDYYWKVKARDNWGAERWSTETWMVQAHYMDDGLTIIAYSPVDLIVTDPIGDSTSLWFNTIPNATYDTTTDYNQDGDKDDIVTIPHRLVGEYIIEVVAEPGGSGSYELGIRVDGGAMAMLTMPGGNPCPPEGMVDTATYYAPWYETGDANGDWNVDVGDVVYLINYLYKGGLSPDPLIAGDATCEGFVDVGDVVYLINYLFKGGPPPSC